ncbi:hypothetical protein AMATHDRAFT_41868 [Amanita thiersii Skay4041]|uniref:Uncharacterized protein n=1 Tax=Amanita thiersii Skay4041 TaxID=703135 RepID=A0A2A9NMJ6_9AGAR|nr:hypothetical protein AMATHDRAFT_41868 [Amanita thiersii Skay4041]
MDNLNDPFPADVDVQSFPAQYKDEGEDWLALYNPNIQRRLDVRLEFQYQLHSVVCCAAISPSAVFIAVGGRGSTEMYAVNTGCRAYFFADPAADGSDDVWIRSLCFHPKTILLATGADDNMIRIWDFVRETILVKLDAHVGSVYSLAFSSDGNLLASCGEDQKVKIWEWNTQGTPCKVLVVHDAEPTDEQYFTSVAFTPDSRHLAVSSMDSVVRIWDVATTTLITTIGGHTNSVYSISFAHDGSRLVSSSFDGSVKLWDTSALITQPESADSGSGTSSAPGLVGQGGTGVSGESGEVGEMSDMYLRRCRLLINFLGHRDYVLCNKVTDNGRWVISGSKDSCIRFWDARTGVVQCELQSHGDSVFCLDVCPRRNGGYLITGGADAFMKLWRFRERAA